MTTAPAIFTRHPLDTIRPGDITVAWCSKSGDRERKLWTGFKLVCLHCHPEQDPEYPQKPQEAL